MKHVFVCFVIFNDLNRQFSRNAFEWSINRLKRSKSRPILITSKFGLGLGLGLGLRLRLRLRIRLDLGLGLGLGWRSWAGGGGRGGERFFSSSSFLD